MKLTRIQIRNFRGIEALEVNVPSAGLIAKGGNARGKSTVLKAVRSVLEARDISADAIRLGADKAEILVDLDNVSVKRAITSKTSTLTVERDGMKASKPTTYLRDLLGTASLDPLEIYLAKPKDRRGLILAALPVTVTREQIEKYAGDFELPIDFDANGHGLEVIERARKYFYDERSVANKEAAEAQRTAERLAMEAKAAAQAILAGPIVPAGEAKAAIVAAEREILALEARVAEAASANARTASQREQIAQLRATADEQIKHFAGDLVDTDPLKAAAEGAEEVVAELRRKLTDAEVLLADARKQLDDASRTNRILDAAKVESASKRAQADALERALAAASVTPPTDAEIGAARTKLQDALVAAERADLQAKATATVAAAEAAKKTAAELQAEADDLDTTVKRLANDAPTELIAAAQGIPGLSIDGDEVLLDGKRLDALSGAEQLKFAVEIARRANDKSKILVVDGLERLDSEQLEVFVAHATAGGWQLVGSLVTGGELVVAAIEPGAQDKAAE